MTAAQSLRSHTTGQGDSGWHMCVLGDSGWCIHVFPMCMLRCAHMDISVMPVCIYKWTSVSQV